MRVKGVRRSPIFIFEDINNSQQRIVHAQRPIPYPVGQHGIQASKEFKQQAAHNDTSYHLDAAINAVEKRSREYEVRLAWLGFESEWDQTWETFLTMMIVVPGLVEYFLYKSSKQNIMVEIVDFPF